MSPARTLVSRPTLLLSLVTLFAACQMKDCVRASTLVPPVCGEKAECGAGRIRTCIDKCRVLAAEGAPCSADPCSTEPACNAGLACVEGICKTARPFGCDVKKTATEPCVDGGYCRSAACPLPPSWPVTTPIGADACFRFTSEGEACDGDYQAALQPGATLCSPCEAGTRCVRAPNESAGICRRPCDLAKGDSQCACGNNRCVAAAVPKATFCDHCAPLGARCREGETPGVDGSGRAIPCCSAAAVCGSSGSCCLPRATACTGDGPCCDTDRCVAGRCQECKAAGVPSNDSKECCQGLVAQDVAGRGRICTPPCGAAGQPCCLGVTCNAGTTCAGGTCLACGQPNQACCAGNVCGGGATCSGGKCVACGQPNQVCCAGNVCSGVPCVGGKCARCALQTYTFCFPCLPQIEVKRQGCSLAETRQDVWKNPGQVTCGLGILDGPCACPGKFATVTMCCRKWGISNTTTACTTDQARALIRASDSNCTWEDGACP